MARDKITEYDSTANNNTVCGDVNIAENSALPSDMNNFAREIMSHLKEGLGSGTPLYVDQTNNRLGIGDSSPDALLSIKGNSDSATTPSIRLKDGTDTREAWITNSAGDLFLVAGGNDNVPHSEIRLFDGNIITFKTANTERLKIDANGHVTMPYQPAFSAKVTTQQNNIAVAGFTTVLFATELYDQNSDYNNSTYTFTAPVTGKYQLNLLLLMTSVDSTATYYLSQIVTSNRTYYHLHDPRGYDTDIVYHNLDTSVLADMDAGDTAIVQIYQSTGTAQTDIDAESYFTGHLVC